MASRQHQVQEHAVIKQPQRRRRLQVDLPSYLVTEVTRAAQVRSRIERVRVSPDQLVERALREYLWLDDDELQVGQILRLVNAVEPDSSVPRTVTPLAAVPVPSTFGTLLRRMRLEHHCEATKLAQALRMRINNLYEIERGVRTPLTEQAIFKAAKILEVDPQPLLDAARR